MALASHRLHYTRADYIALERASNVKHEYLDGVIYAMAGGSPECAAIVANVITGLSVALRERPFRVHSSDLRVRVLETGLEAYPDITIVCGRALASLGREIPVDAVYRDPLGSPGSPPEPADGGGSAQ